MTIHHSRRLRISQPTLLVSVYMVGGSLITIVQRYLTFEYDTLTQNGFRFLAGALVLLLIAFIFHRTELHKILQNTRQLGSIVLLAISTIVPSFLAVEGIRYTSAVMAGLVSVLGVPLTITLAVIFFADERQAARGLRFIFGSALAIGGTLGLTLSNGTLTLEYSLGVVYLLLSTLVGASSALLAKRLVIASEPFCVSGLSSIISALIFITFSVLSGGVAAIGHAAPINNIILFGSGVYGLLLGQGVYMLIIRLSGLIAARFADLAMPVFTGIFGYVLFRELLNPQQLVFGLVLIAGCFLILSKRGTSVVVIGEA